MSAKFIESVPVAADTFAPTRASFGWDQTDECLYVNPAGTRIRILDEGDGTGTGITELTGDVTAGPGTGSQAATLANTAVTPGSYTNTNLTVDAKGRITAAANGTDADTGITQLTGDGTAGPGSGTQALTLASTAVTPGTYTNTTLTVDAKGRLTAASSGAAGAVVAGADTDVQFNDGGAFGADTGLFTYIKASDQLRVNNLGSQVGTTLAVTGTAPTGGVGGAAGTPITVTASAATVGSGAGTNAGGAITLTAGNANGQTSGFADGGAITITGGNARAFSAGQSYGGAVNITGGNGDTGQDSQGGPVNITGGTAGNDTAGAVNITGGPTANTGTAAGAVNITGGTPTAGTSTTAGSVTIKTGDALFTSGAITITTGAIPAVTAALGTMISIFPATPTSAGSGVGVTGGATVIRGGPGQDNGNNAGGAAGGPLTLAGGIGGANARTNAGANGGTGGAASLTAGAGGVESGSGAFTFTGGAGGTTTVAAGAGGDATGGSGTRNGGDGGNVVISAGAGGTGASANGAAGTVTINAGATQVAVASATAFTFAVVARLTPTAYASLPTGAEGMIASINDSNTATWGATIAGGGANKVLGFFNGTNWTVFGA